jgi:hypothetical protein
MKPWLTSTLTATASPLKRLLAGVAVCSFAGAIALLSPQHATAQEIADGPPTASPAPAMGLWEINRPAGMPRLTITNPTGGVAHIFPTVQLHNQVHNFSYDGGTPPLVYHSGGSVMQPSVTLYSIFWTGGVNFPPNYNNLMNRLAQDYPGHGIMNVTTQYYQTIGTTTTYIKNAGADGGNYTDTSAYPASGCTDSATPGKCLTDAQLQSEIKKVMGIKGWTGGLNKIFILYTNSGEGSCFDSSSTSCAFTQYCAYHSFISGSPDIIYANMPYPILANCQEPGAPSPNSNPAADTAMTAASHEISESITDPLLNAWFDSSGNEIGDECAYDYGYYLSYDSGKANQQWNGHFYLLQGEFDNHAFAGVYDLSTKSVVTGYGCSQVGPFASPPSQGAF